MKDATSCIMFLVASKLVAILLMINVGSNLVNDWLTPIQHRC
ncbi:hypothetical protein AAZX31_04G155800 [Glycine max]